MVRFIGGWGVSRSLSDGFCSGANDFGHAPKMRARVAGRTAWLGKRSSHVGQWPPWARMSHVACVCIASENFLFFFFLQSTGYNLLVKHAASSLGDAHMIVNVAVP
jgi:hypothetical protein